MAIFLTIIITLVAWQLLCTLFAFIIDDGEKYCCFSTFIILSIGRITVYPISKLICKIRLKRYNKKYSQIQFWYWNDKTKRYYCSHSWYIKNELINRFNITEIKEKEKTANYIATVKTAEIKHCYDLKEYMLTEKDLTNGMIGCTVDYIANFLK